MIKGLVTILLILSGALLSGSEDRQSATRGDATCSSASQCAAIGNEALQRGRVTSAIRAFREQVGHAEDSHDTKEIVSAYDNISKAYLIAGDTFRSLAWTNLALRLASEDTDARKNLKEIETQQGQLPWPSNFSGVYVQYAGYTWWNSLCIRQTSKGKMQFQLSVYRMGSNWRSYGPASYGDVKGAASLDDHKEAVYQGDKDFPSCRIKMSFSQGSVTLGQDGDCGFGHGAIAEGAYQRITKTLGSSRDCRKENLP